jgi:hypothetical protein
MPRELDGPGRFELPHDSSHLAILVLVACEITINAGKDDEFIGNEERGFTRLIFGPAVFTTVLLVLLQGGFK